MCKFPGLNYNKQNMKYDDNEQKEYMPESN
jgi:hypothetical protein